MNAAVIGGGPAGCAAAYTLRERGLEVQLFEAQEEVGGRTRQLKRDGFNLGSGALFLMGGIYPHTKGRGHYGTLHSLHAEMPRGIYLAGDYFAHAGVEAAVLSGERAANNLASAYDA
jgi:protoporphyrinogen oxidase